MPKLRYEKKTDGKLNLVSKVYQTDSIFGDGDINDMFLQLKANVCDLNPALWLCVFSTYESRIYVT